MAEDHAELAREARLALDLTQRAWATLLGVPQSTIYRWESGERDPGAASVALFALVLDSPRRSLRVLRKRAAERDG